MTGCAPLGSYPERGQQRPGRVEPTPAGTNTDVTADERYKETRMDEQFGMLDGMRMDNAALDAAVNEIVANVNAMPVEEINELFEELDRVWTDAGAGS